MRDDFSLFILACLIFLAFHAIPSMRGLRKKLTGMLGERTYLAFYSLISLVLLVWVIYEATLAPKIHLWPFAMWTYWVPNILMPIAFIFLVAGATTPNPLSIAAPQKGFDPDNPGMIVRVTRHPVLWAFALWSLVHLPPNGDAAVAAMFSVFAIFALLGLKLVDRKRRRSFGDAQWHRLAHKTSAVPFAALMQGRCRFTLNARDGPRVTAGLVLYILFYGVHKHLFGIMPIPPL